MDNILSNWYSLVIIFVLFAIMFAIIFKSISRDRRIRKKVINKCTKIWVSHEAEEVLKAWSYVEL